MGLVTMRHLSRYLSACGLLLVLLAGCGGDDIFNGGGGSLAEGGAKASSLVQLASAPTLSSDASGVAAGIVLTAVAKDENNNVVPGAIVVFSSSDSAEINVENPATTDENGRVQAILTTGGDQANRKITVTATSGNLQASVSVDVVGTELNISGPSGTQVDTPTEFVISLSDAAGNGIAGRSIEISTEPENSLSASTLETDEFGQVTVLFDGMLPQSTLTAVALGLTSSVPISVSLDDFTIGVRRLGGQDLLGDGSTDIPELIVGEQYEVVGRWLRSGSAVEDGRIVQFGATRGQVSASQAPTAEGLALTNLQSSEAGFSILTAFSDELSQPNTRATVEFVATEPSKIEVQASPSNVPRNQSSEIVAIVRDDANNLVKNVTVDFSLSDQTTGELSAPTALTSSQGLARVTYSASSQASGTEAVTVTGKVRGANVSDSAVLTIGGTAANIALGTGSQILIKDESTYQLPFTVIVTDAGGNPVPDAVLSLTLLETKYYEGTFGNKTACSNEDLNSNDILDPGEDSNNNGRLEPGRRASVPATVELDESGAGQFLVTYAKSDGNFISVQLTASVRVAGTESTEKREFQLKVAEADVDNLPGISPFGTDQDCLTNDPPDL